MPNLTRKELAVALAGITLSVFFAFLFYPSHASSILSLYTTDQLDWVDLTLLTNAKDKGAFCLDGSLPAYHFRKGFGSGASNWIVAIQGGSWCYTIDECLSRANSFLGSSLYMEKALFAGILSSDPALNPDFFNWNQVQLRYCDGASLSGHPESELHNGTDLPLVGDSRIVHWFQTDT